MTTSTRDDLTRIAALPTAPGLGTAQRFENCPWRWAAPRAPKVGERLLIGDLTHEYDGETWVPVATSVVVDLP